MSHTKMMSGGMKMPAGKGEHQGHKATYREREFNRLSGRATVRQVGVDVWNVGYSGFIANSCFADLRGDVIQATHGASAVLLRMDKAIAFTSPDVRREAYKLNPAPGVVVVRRDQYSLWAEYAKQTAQVGIIRAIVLADELPMAHQMMECFSGQQLPALQRML